jgi:hypothetical protein
VSSDRWWWAQKAHQLRFTQLDIARRQAEAWRTGLTSITALLGAVLIIKDRTDVADLATPYRPIPVTLFGIALAALVIATLLAIRAASGVPGDECLLTGEDLERWTQDEVHRVQRALRVANVLTVVGACALAGAAGAIWLAPTGTPSLPTVHVQSHQGQYCGQLTLLGDGTIGVSGLTRYYVIPLTSVERIDTVASCKR